MTAEDFWNAVGRRLDAGLAVFVVQVVANTKASPGTLGARLLVDAAGDVEGTIGGGIMEVHVVEAARHHVREDPLSAPTLQRLVHRKDEAEYASGLICAGEQTNLNMLLQPDRDRQAIRLFCEALSEQSTRTARLLVDASGVSVELQTGDGAATTGTGLIEASGGWRYRESSVNPRRLAIVGAGHCGRALARLAVDVGYWVDVFDTRRDIVQEGLWPYAARRHPLGDDAELRWQVHRKPLTSVVVMTASVVHDIASLVALAPDAFHWLGVMGSKAKVHEIRRALSERGIAPALVDAIHGPIGLRMKSDTPAEIAVSIMAQLLADLPPSTAARSALPSQAPTIA